MKVAFWYVILCDVMQCYIISYCFVIVYATNTQSFHILLYVRALGRILPAVPSLDS